MSRTVVITGASAGVGRAAVRAFARAGWDVALIARGRQGLEAAAAEVRAEGRRALVLPADVAEASEVFAAAARVEEEWGGIDVWVNNAMVTVYAPVDEITPAEVERVTRVTYLGQVHGMMAALRAMRGPDRGTIVNIGSALAYRSIPLQSAYCGAKAAVRGFADSLRCELLHDRSRIRLTMVHLPAVDTPQFDWARSHIGARPQPVPPIHAPEAVAPAILRAAETAPREVWVGGTTAQAILGQIAAPGLMDRMMAAQAWEAQEGAPMEDGARPDNLWEPVEGDFGASGRFGDRARRHAVALPSPAVRAGVAAGGILAVAGLALAARAAARR